ncbi:Asp23/Gls24 family envelope stress response protein [Sutcliffiella rhizosphaerae]|uniref:Asp23/Gls24 family envelope stress response protein n=1 Tax=Sutcliffiella rhizosphaerae TaxID=2880967 RepID=A0ABN8A4B3_9BACI|nr:Asp23/Gls24 family envelope stress response protein [Sutcliffiella rhizosphaerae]CAG9619844.1 hypothetical protein BACCIP111883_00612 [Sutcliffiella rhizosphaerae]
MKIAKGEKHEVSTLILQTIIFICVTEETNVKILPPRFMKKFYAIINKEFQHSAVIHFADEKVIDIDLFIAVEYHQPILEVCRMLQLKIKNEIEILTGYHVRNVHISVDGLWKK